MRTSLDSSTVASLAHAIYCYCKDMAEGRATLAGLRATMPQEKG